MIHTNHLHTGHGTAQKEKVRSTTSWSNDASVKCEHRKDQELPGADIGSYYELIMMTFKLCLQSAKKQGKVRIRFSLEKLKDPKIAEIFRAAIGGKLAPLLALETQDTNIDSLSNSFNTAVTQTANNILGKNTDRQRSPGSRITY